MKKFLPVALIFFFLFLNQSCNKDNDEEQDNIKVKKFSTSVKDVNSSLTNFIQKAHEFETTDVTTMPIEDVKPFMDEYIQAAQDYLDAINAVIELEKNKKTTDLKNFKDGPSCSPYDVIPTLDNGVGPGLAKGVGDLIKETKNEVDKIQKQWENGEIDDNEYYEKMNKLKIKKPTKAFNLGLGALAGAGAGFGTGVSIVYYTGGGLAALTTAPAILTIAVVGGTVGALTYWYANWYTGANDKGDSTYCMVSGKTTVGGAIPSIYLGDNANLTIAVDGFAPVTIDHFKLPEANINKTIEIEGVKIDDADWNGSVQVCFSEDQLTASSCSEVMFVSAVPSPADPDPYQGVTVTATLTPVIAGCEISFSIVGTDGYTNSATYESDSNGQASFYIPGGAPGVVDHVTITSSNGTTYTVTYVF